MITGGKTEFTTEIGGQNIDRTTASFHFRIHDAGTEMRVFWLRFFFLVDRSAEAYRM